VHPSDRERDACGTGFVADAAGAASGDVVERALEALCRVRHRGATDTDAKTGDGAGLLLQMLHPAVLAGVWDHSSFRADMHGRLRRTARFIATTAGGWASAIRTPSGRASSICCRASTFV